MFAICLVGCQPTLEVNGVKPESPSSNTDKADVKSGGVAPMATGGGGMTPMTGTDSVEGAGGGGVAQAAKQKAKDKAVNIGGGSLGQGEKDDSGQ